MIWYIVCTTFVLYFFVFENWSSEVRVNIAQGTVIGSYDSYYKFYGIPYADSTSGVNRFQPPKPAPQFDVPFVANRHNTCMRPTRDGYHGVEDCLSLDVLSSKIDSTLKLPVMVWIGRDGDVERELNTFQSTFKNIIDRDIIVVSPNFRESIFGFLCLGTSKSPGNAGLKDIIASLKWIQKNIGAFGGDPHNVTVFGHGNGAAIVDLLTHSKRSEGLFHKVIMQTSTPLAPSEVARDNLQNAIKVADALGHNVEDAYRLSDIFTRVSASALMAVVKELESDSLSPFGPCIETVISSDKEPFLTETPNQILSSGIKLDIPHIIGFMDKKDTLRDHKGFIKDWFSKEYNLQESLNCDTDGDNERGMKQVEEFYSLDNSSEKETLVNIGNVMALISRLGESHIRVLTSNAPTYSYNLLYKGNYGTVMVDVDFLKQAVHNEGLAYTYYKKTYKTCTAYDLAIVDVPVERFSNFGTPTSESSSTECQKNGELKGANILLEDPYLKSVNTECQNWQDEYFLDSKGWDDTPKYLDADDVDSNDTDVNYDGNNRAYDENIGSLIENIDYGNVNNQNNSKGNGNKSENEYAGANSVSIIMGYTLAVLSLLSIVKNLEISEIMF